MPSTSATDKERYKTVECLDWRSREGLVNDEVFIVENYLDPAAKTVEAGTGNGRIILSLRDRGFSSLYGFDLMPEFVETAKQRDPENTVDLTVQDATNLTYPDNTFEQLLYIAQIISAVPTHQDRRKLLSEAYRIAKPGALMIVSFLSWNTRLGRPLHLLYTAYLKVVRTTLGSRTPLQSQPWLKLGDWMNSGALADSPPYLYYFKLHEISEHIRISGFQLQAIGSSYQISHGESFYPDIIELAKHPIRGAIFAVCTKPA